MGLTKGGTMIEGIALLRSNADECEKQARDSGCDREVQAELIDLAAKWRWLAGEGATLCKKSNILSKSDLVGCPDCSEKCF